MTDTDREIRRKLARAIADDAEVDWSSLGLDPSTLRHDLENLRRLSRVANSFQRQLRRSDGSGARTAPSRAARPGRVSVPAGPSGREGGGVLHGARRQEDGSAGSSANEEACSPGAATPQGMQRWGPLEILGVLGEGSFGTVYLAYDPLLEREVALKLWKDERPDLSSIERDRLVRRRLEEARRIARVRHQNVVVIHGVEIRDGRVGIWTERLTGPTLETRHAREGALSAAEVARLGAQIADGLAAVHAAGVIHGDVKEANVVEEPGGRTVLFDFGSGRRSSEGVSLEPFASTPFYVAPEVLLDGAEPGVATDLYACGVLLHRLRTGRYPVWADTWDGLLDAHRENRSRTGEAAAHGAAGGSRSTDATTEEMRDALPPDGRVHRVDAERGSIESELLACIARLLDPEPEKRPSSATEVARTLRFLAERAAAVDRPIRLPEPTTRFFGREDEVRAVRERLRAARLLTVIGIGGCGKTRLVLESIRPLEVDFPDGVFWVPLASVASPAELVPAALRALGMSDRTEPGERGLVLRLATRRVLIVLDNAEHLAESVRALAEDIVQGTAHAHIVVTSRRALGGSTEEVIRLAPLAVPDGVEWVDRELSTGPYLSSRSGIPESPSPDRSSSPAEDPLLPAAVALFADRARRRDPEFDLRGSRASVELICRRLEGIPLAIEIAAARAAALSPEEIAAQLPRPLDLGEDTAAPRQHRSLRASMEWSHDLLPLEAREGLRRLSVFAGGWTTAAAIEVVGRPDFVVLETLATLLEHSLIERRREAGGRLRFNMLETVREFAEEQLETAGETEATRARHHAAVRDLFLRESRRLRGPEYGAALALLDEENANLDRALAWGLAAANTDPAGAESHIEQLLGLIDFWHLSGRDSAARRHLDAALLALAGRLHPRAEGRLLLARGRFYYLCGFRAAEADLLHAAALLAPHDPIEHAVARASLGAVATALLRFDEAEDRLLGALSDLQQDPAGRCRALTYLADLRFKQGRMNEALAYVDQAEPIANELGSLARRSTLMLLRASVAWANGDLSESLRVHEDCLDRTAAAPFLAARVICHSHLGHLLAELGRPLEARRRFELAERMARRWGEDVRRAIDLINLATHFPLEERPPVLFEALEALVRFDHLRNALLALAELGDTYLLLGRPDLGVRLLAAAEQIRVTGKVALPAPSQTRFEAMLVRAREALPADAISKLWEVGRTSSLDDVRALIREELARLPSAAPQHGGASALP